MFMSLMSTLLFMIISGFILGNFILSLSFVSDNQLTPLESGFESMMQSTMMSSSFLMMATLFVIFDVELVLLLPLILSHLSLTMGMTASMSTLLFIVLLSLMMEWSWFGLKWST